MDIAKIRKKLQKTRPEDRESTSEKETQGGTEGKRVEQKEKPSEEHTFDAQTRDNEQSETRDEKNAEKPVEKPGVKKQEVEEAKEDEVVEILTFNLLKEEFAFKISQLAEILRPQKITVVPRLPKYVLGVTSLRGKVIPVLDLKLKLSLTAETSGINAKEKILIIKGLKGPIGATIDKVLSVVRVGRHQIVPPPSHLAEAELKFIEGIAVIEKRFISIINMEEALAIQF
jgi:purine-binding chemotaxis protein CheW